MPLDEQRLEEFAMQAALQPQSHKRPGWLEIEAVGSALGMTREEAFECASLLAEEGWVNTQFTDANWLRLTMEGRRAIRRLRRPDWQRWMDRHPTLVTFLWTTLSAIIAGIICTVITYFFVKPS